MKTKTKKRGSTDSANESVAAEPRLLCEGWLDEGCEGSCVFVPESAYVVQGDRVWFAYGRHDLDESLSDAQIVEAYDELELEERTVNGTTVKLPKGGRWVVEGPGQRSDVKNANQRTYSRKIWEKLVADKDSYVQQAISERQMVGHLEHPKDGRTDLNNAAILTTKAELREDGVVWNQFELLDTPGGMILQELTRKGVKWGVSSRGTGTVGDDGQVSEDDYTLKTWDAVASPSTPGAHPKLVLYGRRNENTEEDAPVLSEEGLQTLTTLTELTETEADGLPVSVQLRQDILAALASLDENDLQAALLRDQGWATIHAAVERAREVSRGASIDTAIEEALADGELDEEGSNLLVMIDDLQEQVSDSVAENIELRGQLEAAESERTAQTERLAEVEGELAQLRVECDLARELLAETPGRNSGDVAAAADEAISEEPELERFRDLMESVETVEQVRTLAERLAPVVRKPEPVEETEAPAPAPKPRRPARTALPVGTSLNETANVKRSVKRREIAESSGARIVAGMPGFKKSS
jgi:hypothetical protein